MHRKILAQLALTIGAILALTQTVADDPWQAGLVLGLILGIAGGVVLFDPPAENGSNRGR